MKIRTSIVGMIAGPKLSMSLWKSVEKGTGSDRLFVYRSTAP